MRASGPPLRSGRPMPEQTPAPRRRNVVPAVLAGVFLVIFYVLVFSGGYCERYERKEQRRELMRQYLDSMRR
jgi:hypothetical protein